jgi:tellurite resistance protein TehA-like permease
MNLLVPLAVVPLAAPTRAPPLLLLVGLVFFGIGLVLFLALLPLVVARLPSPRRPRHARPSLLIPLAPAGSSAWSSCGCATSQR